MSSVSHAPQINWSVWDKSATVSWRCNGQTFAIVFNKPPLSVTDLSSHSLIGIAGSYDEFGSENLLLYTYDGILQQTFIAPELGASAHFGRILENRGRVCAIVGFFDKIGWVEMEGDLDLVDGTLDQLHRGY